MLSDSERQFLTGLARFVLTTGGRLLLTGLALGAMAVMFVVISGVIAIGVRAAGQPPDEPVRIRRLAPRIERLPALPPPSPTPAPTSYVLAGGFEVTEIDLPPPTSVSSATPASEAPTPTLAPSPTPTATVAPLLTGWPAGGRVSQGFGCSEYFTGITAPQCQAAAPWFHDGLDIAAQAGAPVRAALAGTVAFAGPDTAGPRCGDEQGYGLSVIIDHAQGWQALYAHLSRIDVEAGQPVQPDTLIGAVGATGCTSGPHLHFGLKRQGQLVDPMLFILQESTIGR